MVSRYALSHQRLTDAILQDGWRWSTFELNAHISWPTTQTGRLRHKHRFQTGSINDAMMPTSTPVTGNGRVLINRKLNVPADAPEKVELANDDSISVD